MVFIFQTEYLLGERLFVKYSVDRANVESRSVARLSTGRRIALEWLYIIQWRRKRKKIEYYHKALRSSLYLFFSISLFLYILDFLPDSG